MDIRTILYVNLFLLAGCTVGLAVIALHNTRFREFRWFAIAYAAGGISTWLRMLQGHVPDFFSLVLSNLMVMAALLLLHRCFAAFVNAGRETVWLEALLLIAVFAGLFYYTCVHRSFVARSLLMGLACMVLAGMSAYVLMRHADAAVRIPCVATGILFLAFGLLMVIHCAGIVLGGAPHDFFIFSISHLMGFLGFYVLIAGLPLSYFWMTSARLYARQEMLARTDFLTGLPNRRCLEEIVEREMRRIRHDGMPLTLLTIDIDHFKRINDQYGHDAGDSALRSIASALASAMRPRDRIARLGGEEFIAVLADTGIEDAMVVAERLRVMLEELSIVAGQHILKTTASFGVATFASTDTLEMVLRRADRALYTAKLSGRNRTSVESGWMQNC